MSWQAKILGSITKLTLKRQMGKSGDVVTERANLEKMTKLTARQPKGESAEIGGVPGEWLTPPGADDKRVILYLHGGGYVMGSLDSHRDMVYRIAEAASAKTFMADYRLGPEDPFPAAVEDGAAAFRGLVASGVPADKIVIGGDSAGGGLTIATMLKLRADGDPMPAAGVCLSPWTDLSLSSPSMVTKAKADVMLTPAALGFMAENYLKGQDAKAPLASPVYANCAGLPPMLVQVGGEEVLLDDATRFADKAKADGVDITLEEWPGMMHVWHLMAQFLPEGKRAIGTIGEYVRARTGG